MYINVYMLHNMNNEKNNVYRVVMNWGKISNVTFI